MRPTTLPRKRRRTEEPHDEVFVVAHSLGGAIALDALAEYGTRLGNTYFITRRSALGGLVQQEPLIEEEIARLYASPTPIDNWVDVGFRADMMASRVPVPAGHGRKFHRAIEPRTPRGTGTAFGQLHDGYYNCPEAVLMLADPAADLPRFDPDAETGQLTGLHAPGKFFGAS